MNALPLDARLEAADVFYPVRTWPVRYRRLFYSNHLNYLERYDLFKFYWLNGMDPDMAASWTLARGGYDRSARNHVLSLVVRAKEDEVWSRLQHTYQMEWRPVHGL